MVQKKGKRLLNIIIYANFSIIKKQNMNDIWLFLDQKAAVVIPGLGPGET